MFGPEELILIFLAILILFGANKLPELARSLGSATGEFKKAKMQTDMELTQLTNTNTKIEVPRVSQNIIKLARELNIDTVGKDEDKILEEIRASLVKPRIVEEK